MKRTWISNIAIAAIISLLTVFLYLQYNWLQQANAAERERMQKRVESDTKAFAEEFNKEIQAAYYNFQTTQAAWTVGRSEELSERFNYWRGKTSYPDLIREVIFLPNDPVEAALRFDIADRSVASTTTSPELTELRRRAAVGRLESVVGDGRILAVPVYPTSNRIDRIFIRKPGGDQNPAKIPVPEPIGYVAVVLDEVILREKMLGGLAAKYFGDGEYRTVVTDRSGAVILGTAGDGEPDASAGLFDMRPDNLIFFANRELQLPRTSESIAVAERIESHTFTRTESGEKGRAGSGTFTIQVKEGSESGPTTRVFATAINSNGPWTIQARHRVGSVSDYITAHTRQSFAAGLAIYLLLAGSIVAIVLSANRARRYAQRQVDFVSSVSHEFRTPLAVIYSAGENLADGVAKDPAQISRYGELIKGEGRKLSAMVEQILEFAGARSGKRSYKLEPVPAADIVLDAISECMPMIEENAIELESDVPLSLPEIAADRTALSRAIQNLIANSVKYSNGTRWVRVDAKNSGSTMRITVQDRGIGIAGDDLKHIFEPFYRSKDVVDAQIHGNGLGLSLVKEIADAHGGTIRATSEKGKGSVFTLELPAIEHI